MKVNRNIQNIALATALGFASFSCIDQDDEPVITEPQAQATLTASASQVDDGSSNSRVAINGFTASQFTVGTRNVEMTYASKADLLGGISIGDIELKTSVNASLQTSSSSPKSLVLVSSGQARVSTVGEGETPEGNYTKVDFDLYENTEVSENDPMFEKSILIAGEIDGQLTTIWTEMEKTITARSENSAGVEVDGETEMMLDFDMEKLFEGIDFTTAVDSDGDGRIEISPNSPDGNSAILAQIESNIESAVLLKKN